MKKETVNNSHFPVYKDECNYSQKEKKNISYTLAEPSTRFKSYGACPWKRPLILEFEFYDLPIISIWVQILGQRK